MRWICVFAGEYSIRNDDGQVVLFGNEQAALEAGIAEYGESCREYLEVQEAVDG